MKISLRNFLLLPVLCLLFQMQWARAQDDPQYRMEIGAGVGTVAYEGDLNGNILARTCSRWQPSWEDIISTHTRTCGSTSAAAR